MTPDVTDFKDLVAAWPEPVQLTHLAGDEFLTLYHRTHYIEAKWTNHITADDVVTAAKVYLSLMQEKPHAKLLNNKTDATGDWSDANDWLEFEWLPKAIQAGLRCLAHVYSNNMFSRLSARDLHLRLLPNIHMRNFDERDEAVAWLLSHEAASEITDSIRG
jgi:hypothetical protein